MYIEDFNTYISVLNDRFCCHWKFMNRSNPDQWPLDMDKDEWIEEFIAIMDNDNNDKD
jgi:hypothetical protein